MTDRLDDETLAEMASAAWWITRERGAPSYNTVSRALDHYDKNIPSLIAEVRESRTTIAALRGERDQARAVNRSLIRLFAGGPDTSCRTVWDDGIECVSVPIEDLRAALADAGQPPHRCIAGSEHTEQDHGGVGQP